MKIEFHTDQDIEVRNYLFMKKLTISGEKYNNKKYESTNSEDINVTIDGTNAKDAIFKIVRSNQRIDGLLQYKNPMDLYAAKLSEPLNQLDIKLSDDGNIQSIENREKVLKNWEYIKLYIDNCFKSEDEDLMSYLVETTHGVDEIVKDDKEFLETVKLDYFYSLFFAGYWLDFSNNEITKTTKTYNNIFRGASVALNESIRIKEDNDGFKLIIRGNINREKSDKESICESLGIGYEEYDTLNVHSDIECFIDKCGLPQKIVSFVSVNLPDNGFNKEIGVIIDKKKKNE